ncbi:MULTISPECIES: phage head morphogenesis protein [unclassified Aurantimonas]|uniref:phage head morphogenesis protein n=1 Tax=unclassified Aurantimonas TaxID=2638230 RepID=UPI002E18FD5A|nr:MULTISPECIES: phage minor head protein [unclassified Aurantimonas]MEC5289396.1 phage minor head protein [Aurantimonas sp. C2-3-R2]MEC5410476.1 phage minor head protein [Aurantimonas sp. C2-4-R8]
MAATKTRRPTITLPPIQDSIGARREYERALRAMLRSLAATVRSEVLPAAEAEIARQRAAMTQDAIGEYIFEGLKQLAVRLGVIAEGMVGRILRLESERHTKKWLASVRSTIGIDLAAVVSQEDLAEYLITAAARNASLIKSLAGDTVKRVEQTIYSAVINGETVAQVRMKLTKDFSISDRRAKVIARTEVAKLTSDLNRRRHEQAGITEYAFATSQDERVRKNHKAMEGLRCRYDDASVYLSDGKWVSRSNVGGVQLHPGQDVQCRCVSRAFVRIGDEEF